jgi:hypothetical protein
MVENTGIVFEHIGVFRFLSEEWKGKRCQNRRNGCEIFHAKILPYRRMASKSTFASVGAGTVSGRALLKITSNIHDILCSLRGSVVKKAAFGVVNGNENVV